VPPGSKVQKPNGMVVGGTARLFVQHSAFRSGALTRAQAYASLHVSVHFATWTANDAVRLTANFTRIGLEPNSRSWEGNFQLSGGGRSD
jgi:hypothetical protein